MGSSRFYSVLAALLFTAVCAWTGSALLRSLGSPPTAVAASATIRESAQLQGIVLRREETVFPGRAALLTAEEGKRLSPGQSYAEGAEPIAETALFFTGCDGFEYLSPNSASSLTPETFSELMAAEAKALPRGSARLVYGFDFYYAAALTDGDIPRPGPCRLLFEGREETCPARIVSLCTENGETVLLLRITGGSEELMSLRFCKARLIYAEHTGLEVPLKALRQRPDGTYFVYTGSAGEITERSVELIYSDSRRCILSQEDGYGALKEGDRVLLGDPKIEKGNKK